VKTLGNWEPAGADPEVLIIESEGGLEDRDPCLNADSAQIRYYIKQNFIWFKTLNTIK